MMISKGALIGFMLALLGGCATAGIQSEDMSKLGTAPTADDIAKITHGAPLYRLDYLAGGHSFVYETYEESDTVDYYGLLFQDEKLIAVDVTQVHSAYWPDVVHCTAFPPDPGRDVDRCFQDFNQVVKSHAVNLGNSPTPAQKVQSPSAAKVVGTAIEGTVYIAFTAPIVIPVLVIALPVLGILSVESKYRAEPLDVTLGEPYEDIRSRVESYPAKFFSITSGNGTVLIPSTGPQEVGGAFGIADGKVIWMTPTPRAGCGGTMFMAGSFCAMGRESHVLKHVPHTPRPPVIDEWENIALYYSPPPAHYDVLGEVSGKPAAFTSKGRMEEAIEEMKKAALKDGATAVLVDMGAYAPGPALTVAPPIATGAAASTAAPAAGTGTPVYGADVKVPFYGELARGLEIYVPADADAFLKAAQAHASDCDALSQKKDDAKDVYGAAKDTGNPDAVAAAKQALQVAEDAKDAAFCGDDDWYAERMTAQRH